MRLGTAPCAPPPCRPCPGTRRQTTKWPAGPTGSPGSPVHPAAAAAHRLDQRHHLLERGVAPAPPLGLRAGRSGTMCISAPLCGSGPGLGSGKSNHAGCPTLAGQPPGGATYDAGPPVQTPGAGMDTPAPALSRPALVARTFSRSIACRSSPIPCTASADSTVDCRYYSCTTKIYLVHQQTVLCIWMALSLVGHQSFIETW